MLPASLRAGQTTSPRYLLFPAFINRYLQYCQLIQIDAFRSAAIPGLATLAMTNPAMSQVNV